MSSRHMSFVAIGVQFTVGCAAMLGYQYALANDLSDFHFACSQSKIACHKYGFGDCGANYRWCLIDAEEAARQKTNPASWAEHAKMPLKAGHGHLDPGARPVKRPPPEGSE